MNAKIKLTVTTTREKRKNKRNEWKTKKLFYLLFGNI